ncbi:hypothetical protein FSP39_010988 [Pinctada imbricata]|uniref:Flavin-containing monooxygenase n=1 Tax=Pinctada imbricata TaxID=66713 RepID=A0AA88XL46_PINIB|nr:hypothetical protein FSP39_010988 [Pinctada imbricata]
MAFTKPTRVAVIGAGASGLAAIKTCVEDNLEPVCFEKTDHIGGLWYYTEDVVEGCACVMKSTVVNTSKEMMSFSDFPVPKEYPNLMHHSYVMKYFHLYADNFGLMEYIRFNTEVMAFTKPTRVAVIGAGASGLAAIKTCLEESLEPVCFEKTDHIGGLWYYTEDVVEGCACVMKSTVVNTSKEMMSFSDFPVPKEYPNLMHHSYVMKYFHLYADNFGLKEYIRFNTEVIRILKQKCFSSSGQWEVQIRKQDSGEIETLVFDSVMVCSGHFSEKYVPKFRGVGDFKGKMLHSHDYKDFRGYENMRILVIGLGNSAADVAVELSRVASQVFVSTRRGSWISTRVGDNGYPFDLGMSRRFERTISRKLPFWVSCKKLEWKLNSRVDHRLYSLSPVHPPLSQIPTINEELPYRILTGFIRIKTDIERLTENCAVFEDGSSEKIDCVIFATGYTIGFPFLDKSIIDVKENQVNLYKWMFPPGLEWPTLCMIGCVQPVGALMPVSENQCRGEITLPHEEGMWNDINAKQKAMAKQYVSSKRFTIQENFIDYMDELAEMGGYKPKLLPLLLKDPKLAIECIFGPCTPYQYRLMGPNAWAGARDAIMTQWDRIHYPLQTRPVEHDDKKYRHDIIYFTFHVFVVISISFLLLCLII